MHNSVMAHINLIKGHHIFGRGIRNLTVRAELPSDGVFAGQQIRDLYKTFFALFYCHKVNFSLIFLRKFSREEVCSMRLQLMVHQQLDLSSNFSILWLMPFLQNSFHLGDQFIFIRNHISISRSKDVV